MTCAFGLAGVLLLLAVIAVRVSVYLGDGVIGTVATLAVCMPVVALLLAGDNRALRA